MKGFQKYVRLGFVFGWGRSLGLALALAPSPGWGAALTDADLSVQTVAKGLVNPFSLAFLPGGQMLVTERPGRLRLVQPDGRLSQALPGLPPVQARGQCGLLDVLPDPGFSQNHRIYWSYTEPGTTPEGTPGNSVAVASARLDLEAEQLLEVKVIFRQQPKVDSSLHCAGRLALDGADHLFLTLGERFSRKEDAQRLNNHLGKVVRIHTDGRVPADNPFRHTPGALPELWSFGHRNAQGAALHPSTGELWISEHGPQGGDELNISRAGKNYGWPVITHGRNYGTGTVIGEGTQRADVEPALRYWVPLSVAPSGMAFVTSQRYPGWQGSVLLGTLRAQNLIRLTLAGNKVLGEERLLAFLKERIRDVRQGPDGWIYLLTDNPDGRLLRLVLRQ
jgi:glucose/arabinose dehydrogenase